MSTKSRKSVLRGDLTIYSKMARLAEESLRFWFARRTTKFTGFDARDQVRKEIRNIKFWRRMTTRAAASYVALYA